jgi:hypothetical protein
VGDSSSSRDCGVKGRQRQLGCKSSTAKNMPSLGRWRRESYTLHSSEIERDSARRADEEEEEEEEEEDDEDFLLPQLGLID